MQVYTRQIDIISSDKFNHPIAIIGAGATGSWVALWLAKMGLNNIRIWDSDSVEEHNFPNQLFRLKDLAGYKAEKTAEIVKEFTGATIPFFNTKYESSKDGMLEGIVILAVDGIDMRKKIYQECLKQRKNIDLLIDPRTGGETFRIYTIDINITYDRQFYEKFFYPADKVTPLPCTASSIIYNVGIVSGMICNQVKRFLMNQSYYKEIIADAGNVQFLTK